MIYLVYISSAVRLLEDRELQQLADACRRNNASHGITGMLLYKGGNFMQLLEGEEAAVLELYGVIQQDARHKDVTLIRSGELTQRNFADWSMGFCNMDQAGDQPRYGDYIRQQLTLKEFHGDSQKAYRFMRMFNETNR